MDDDRFTARLSRMALGTARAAARSGRSALTGEAERAIDGVLAGPLPESAARSLVEHRVVERVVSEWLEAVAADPEQRERLEQALLDAIGSRLTESLALELVHSPGFKTALAEVLESPEVRHALTRQTAGFGTEMAEALRRRTNAVDDRLQARRAVAPGYGGLATRAVGLVVDALLALVVFLVAAGAVTLVASLAGSLHRGWLAGVLAGGGWVLAAAVYFVVFWSTAGQTPGMRLMGVRVVTGSGAAPPVWRSVVRFAGLVLAIIPMFLGFLTVPFDRRRRALPDYLAGTVVLSSSSGDVTGAASRFDQG
jgi:uncharacterized RDD family membrane protein YckC